jgi:hypothetical protein
MLGRRRRHPARRACVVAALTVLGAVVVALVAASGDSEATHRVRLAAQELDGGRVVRVTGTETADGACIEVRNGGGLGQACGLAAPARDEIRVFEDYGAGVSAFVIYAGARVSAVRVETRSGVWRIKRFRRAERAGDMQWFTALRFGLLVRKGHVAQPKLVALGPTVSLDAHGHRP